MCGLIFFLNFGLVLGIISSNVFFYFFLSLLSFGRFTVYVVGALSGVPRFSETAARFCCQIHCGPFLMNFTFNLFYFAAPEFPSGCFYNFYLFISIFYLMRHFHHAFPYTSEDNFLWSLNKFYLLLQSLVC